MADVIKKAIASSSILSELDWNANGYLIRYRIRTENRNQSSHWSPIYLIPIDDFEDVEGSYFESIGEDSKINITVVWDDIYNRPSYDVFVCSRDGLPYGDEFEYDGDLFHYHGIAPTHNYSFVKRQGTSSIRIIVQPSSNIKRIKDNFIIYDSDNPLEIES